MMEDKQFEEKMEDEIRVEEEETRENGAEKEPKWSEEFVVAAEDLVAFVRDLIGEIGVRRLVVKNEERRLHLEIPLAIGMAGIALLPVYSALALMAALVTECTILVERAEPTTSENSA